MDLRTADVDDALVFTPPGNGILETSVRFEASEWTLAVEAGWRGVNASEAVRC